MRIFFNHRIKGAFAMLEELKKQIATIKNLEDNSMEDSWSFNFNNIKFFIVYDRYSEKNEMIPNFSICSYAADEGNVDKTSADATQTLYQKLKQIEEICNLFFEEE